MLTGAGFIALSLVEAQEALLSLFGGHSAVPRREGPREVHPAEAAVRAFNQALQAAYEQGDLESLPAELLTPSVREQLTQELAFRQSAGQGPSPLRSLTVLMIEPTEDEGWVVLSEEEWAPHSPGAPPSRVRFRYTLAPSGEALQVTEIAPAGAGRSP